MQLNKIYNKSLQCDDNISENFLGNSIGLFFICLIKSIIFLALYGVVPVNNS